MSKAKLIQIQCPCCQSQLWIDGITQKVIKCERVKKEKGSLDDLLVQEKRRKGEFDRKFEATAELEKERWKIAQQKFKQAISGIDESDDKEDKE